MATTKAQTEIQQAAIYRRMNKFTHEVLYIIKSDSQVDTWYTLRFDHAGLAWTCDCPATKPCKHIRAVLEVLKLRRARLAEQIGGDMPAVIATIEAEQEACEEISQAEIAEAILAAERCRKAPVRSRETGREEDTPEHPAPLYGLRPAVSFGCTKTCKRAKQFADLPLNGNAGFSLLKPAQ